MIKKNKKQLMKKLKFALTSDTLEGLTQLISKRNKRKRKLKMTKLLLKTKTAKSLK